MIDTLSDEFSVAEDGSKILRNKEYNGETFGMFVASARAGRPKTIIENVAFNDCEFQGGASLFNRVILKNVLLDKSDEGDIGFDAENILEGVVVKGSSGTLWMREPFGEKHKRKEGVILSAPQPPYEFNLDVSEFYGDLDLLHVEPEYIRINKDIQFVCESQRFETSNWRDDKELSKLAVSSLAVKARMSSTGVFVATIMQSDGRVCERTKETRDALRSRGIVD